MKDVLKFLEDFSPIFRDYIPGIAAAIAAALAILTYQRAKETFLQPVRTEVIKKQTDLLIHVLERVDGDLKIMDSYDVHKLVEINLLAAMLESGELEAAEFSVSGHKPKPGGYRLTPKLGVVA